MARAPIKPACPHCGYDLSGTAATWVESSPLAITCTECGRTRETATVLCERRCEPGWSFEHGRGRRIRRFLDTTLRLSCPVFFWRGLPRAANLHPVRLAAYVLLFAFFCYACIGAMHARDTYQQVILRQGMMGSIVGTVPFNTPAQYRAVALAALSPEQNLNSFWGIAGGWGAIALLGALLIPVFLLPFNREILRRGGSPAAFLRGATYQFTAIFLAWAMLSYLNWDGRAAWAAPRSYGAGPSWSYSGLWYLWHWDTRATVTAFVAWTLLYWWSFIKYHSHLPRAGLIFLYAVMCGFGASTYLLLHISNDLPRLEVGCFLADVFGQPPTAQD
jgi:hypothetical protein